MTPILPGDHSCHVGPSRAEAAIRQTRHIQLGEVAGFGILGALGLSQWSPQRLSGGAQAAF